MFSALADVTQHQTEAQSSETQLLAQHAGEDLWELPELARTAHLRICMRRSIFCRESCITSTTCSRHGMLLAPTNP